MADHLTVWLDGTHAGTLTRARNGEVTFEYARTYQDLRAAAPLSLSMPRHVARHAHDVVAPWIDNLLPDNDDVRARWAASYGERRPTAFNLLRHMGADCAGAVQILPPDTTPDDDAGLTPVTDADIAQHLRALRRDAAAWTFGDHGGRFSLGGAQGKFALTRGLDGWHQPTGRTASTHIFKIGVDGLEHSDLAEHVTMRAARALGLTVAGTSTVRFEDQVAVVVERYDRLQGADGAVRRLHQEDLCQALGLWRASKYEADGGPGLGELAGVIGRATAPRGEAQAREAFAEGVAFNWVTAGTDAHAKNAALLHVGTRSALAPAYDLVSTALLLPHTEVWHQGRLAVRMGGEYRLKGVTLRHLERAAGEMGVDPGWFVGRCRELAQGFPDAVRDVCASLGDLIAPTTSAAFTDGAARRAKDAQRVLAA